MSVGAADRSSNLVGTAFRRLAHRQERAASARAECVAPALTASPSSVRPGQTLKRNSTTSPSAMT